MPDPRQSMAGLSMWGGGSQYGPAGPGSEMYQMHPHQQMHPQMMSPGYFNPHAQFAHPGMGMGMNPFDSPLAGSEHGSVRAPSFYPPYPQGQQGGHPGMGAPRNTVMSNLAGMAGPTGGGGGMPNPRMSTFSLATTANPLQQAAPLEPSDDASPEDGEVLAVLRRYLAQQDLMSV
jgi:chitin synthase